EAAAVVVGDDEDAPAQRGQVVGAAAAREADLRPGVVRADQGRVEVAVGVDLGAAEEGVVHQTALAGLHDVTHAGRHEAPVEGARVADADRHGGQLRGDAAGLEEDDQVRRGGALGEHGGGAGHARADGDGAAVLQQAGGTADHQLHRVVVHGP